MHDAVLHNFVRGMHDLFRNDSMQVVYRCPSSLVRYLQRLREPDVAEAGALEQ
jgi:hypothetical protein